MRRLSGLVAAAMVVAATVAGAALAGSPGNSGVTGTASPGIDRGSAIVQLKGDPLATYSKTKPPQGKKIDFSSTTVKSYRAQLSALRNDYKQWLQANAPKAQITGSYDVALNAVAVQLNGETLSKVSSAPQVQQAQYEGLYTRQTADADMALVSAPQAWSAAGGPANAGKGVKVAIIDSGIAVDNPCFSDTGFPATMQSGPAGTTNNKVIFAAVFNHLAKNKGYVPYPAVGQEHGTHVSGTVACDYNTPAVIDGVQTYNMSGVAPAAQLGNFNIFPADVVNARSEDILDALQSAYTQGYDVANMSLGGSSQGIQDLLGVAINNFDDVGMVVAVAAGNDGPGHYTVDSPGNAAKALTAGAATVGQFIGAKVTVAGISGIVGARPGELARATTNISAPLAPVTGGSGVAGLNTACSPLSVDLTGKIAVVSRGGCFFSVKARNAEAAHAVAVLIVNTLAGDPVVMATDGLPSQPSIPAYMVANSFGATLAGKTGAATTIPAALSYIYSGNNDKMSDFSSQGPTDVDFRVKPDVVAPGENIISSWPKFMCDGNVNCFGFMQGTSMATPHLAGAAAFLASVHPTWSAAQIRSAIVNTADQNKLTTFDSTTNKATDVNIIGSGRLNVAAANRAHVALDPVSLSFGAVPSGSGQTLTRTIALSSLNGAALPTSVTITGQTGAGVTFSAQVSGGTLTVTMSETKTAPAGDRQGILHLFSGGTEVAHAALYTLIK